MYYFFQQVYYNNPIHHFNNPKYVIYSCWTSSFNIISSFIVVLKYFTLLLFLNFVLTKKYDLKYEFQVILFYKINLTNYILFETGMCENKDTMDLRRRPQISPLDLITYISSKTFYNFDQVHCDYTYILYEVQTSNFCTSLYAIKNRDYLFLDLEMCNMEEQHSTKEVSMKSLSDGLMNP